MATKHAETVSIFRALGDTTRLEILDMLATGKKCACDLLKNFDFTQPTLSYHMKILTSSGIVSAKRKGSWVFYTLNKEFLATGAEYCNYLANSVDETAENKE